MASIFTYQEEPPRIHSPWSTPGTSTPQALHTINDSLLENTDQVVKLEPEHPEGPTEYKLHLLLRPRRKFRSASTSASLSGLHHGSFPVQAIGTPRLLTESSSERPLSQPSSQLRQNRLHQLTTQLLWRLQQSSPFHSSSNAELVLPLLPEATPKLGVPDRPAKLLPGLEESQGALYEIGVADDGCLIGLVEDELQESLTNLGAMAASLGCVTKILRKVSVGSCEWVEMDGDASSTQISHDALWVAEVLVYPDSRKPNVLEASNHDLDQTASFGSSQVLPQIHQKASTEQIRVTLIGATGSGKSSVLGTLSTSMLDNGRGKSRLSLLKHRHEISSGLTSSVAQELVGYAEDGLGSHAVINYASGNVSSWIDIHNLSQRLVFLSDSPGLLRFAKSTIRALISWKPAWTILCVAADDGEQEAKLVKINTLSENAPTSGSKANEVIDSLDTTMSHLQLCLRLNLPLIIVITKMDLANKAGLRLVLTKLLSALKAAGRKPVIFSNTLRPSLTSESGDAHRDLQSIRANDLAEVDSLMGSMANNGDQQCVPIVMTSAVTGSGINKLHALLCSLKLTKASRLGFHAQEESVSQSSLFHVDEVFSIPPSRVYLTDQDDRLNQQGIVLCGHVAHGTLSVGDILDLGPFPSDSEYGLISTPARQPLLSTYSNAPVWNSHAERVANVLSTAYSSARNVKTRPDQMCGPFLSVRVVSLRNLRLPVICMQQGETGTVGVELTTPAQNETKLLERARKGMILVDTLRSGLGKSQELTGCRGFSASFPSAEFSQTNSPPLILGGHALVYVNSIRAAVKVTAVALEDEEEDGSTLQRHADHATLPSDDEVFTFDSDEETQDQGAGSNSEQNGKEGDSKDIKITFRFVSTVEWMAKGDQVLVVPTVTSPGPITGAAVLNVSALAGFVGKVCECFG